MSIAGLTQSVQRHALITYVSLATLFTWVIMLPLVARAHGWIGLQVPFALHYLALLGPLIAAVIVISLTEGRSGLAGLGGRLMQWQLGRWWLLAVGSPVAMFGIAAVLTRVITRQWLPFRQLGAVDFLPYLGVWALVLWLLCSGLGIEVGWRGFALPLLQERYSALVASLIIWVLGTCWYLPAYFYLPIYQSPNRATFPGFVLVFLAATLLLTQLYNYTNGSLLAVVLWGGLFNFFSCAEATKGLPTAALCTLLIIWAFGLLVLGYLHPAEDPGPEPPSEMEIGCL